MLRLYVHYDYGCIWKYIHQELLFKTFDFGFGILSLSSNKIQCSHSILNTNTQSWIMVFCECGGSWFILSLSFFFLNFWSANKTETPLMLYSDESNRFRILTTWMVHVMHFVNVPRNFFFSTKDFACSWQFDFEKISVALNFEHRVESKK